MKKYAAFFIILAGCCWGAIGIFVRALNNYGIESMEIVWLRAVSAVCVIGVVTFIYDKSLFKIKLKHIWCIFGTAIVGILFFNLCYFKTIEAASLSVAAVLLYTAPIFVMIFSAILFKEKITKRKVVSLIMAFIGCMLVSGVFDGSAVLSLKGIIIGMGAGLGYGLYTIFSRYALNYGYHPFTVQFYTFLIGTIGGGFLTDFQQIQVSFRTYGILELWVIIGIGVISTAIPNVVYTIGLQYIDNGKTSVMASVEPVMAILLGVFVFHEIPTFTGFVGIILVLSAMIIINLKEKNKEESV